jgi:hypothetical protein
VSPNGKRVAVINYSLNTFSLYDLTNPAIPVDIVGSFASNLTSPFCVVWSDNDTFWMFDYGIIGHFVKVTGASGGAPSVGAATAIDGTIVQAIGTVSVTPDGSKIILAGSQPKVYILTTATSVITSVAAPVSAAIAAGWLDNTHALVIYGPTPTAAILTVPALTFDTSTALASAALASPLGVYGFTDGHAALVIENVVNTTRGNVRHLMMPSSGATVNINEYTNWSGIGTPSCAAVDDHGNIYVCTSNGNMTQWYGTVFNIQPSYDTLYGHKAVIRVTPAH